MKKPLSAPQFSSEPEASRLAGKRAGVRYDNLSFQQETCAKNLAQTEFYECRFQEIVFTGSGRGCLFADAVFEGCDFSNCDFSETVFRRVRMIRCRLTGTDLSRGTFQDFEADSCKADYINLSGSHFKNALLKDCILAHGALSDCRMEQYATAHSDYTECEFLHTALAGIDFSDSELAGISVCAEDLKGVIVNASQAVSCAEMLGIIIK